MDFAVRNFVDDVVINGADNRARERLAD